MSPIPLLSLFLCILPPNEAYMLDRIARKYELTQDQAILLAAIRRAENGGPGLEFGVGQDQPGHQAKRYAKSPTRSFLVQGQWAAGTIKKRYTGDLAAFARRYCPKNAITWQKNVEWWISSVQRKRRM